MFAVAVIPDFELQAVLRHCPELRDRPVALLTGEAKKGRVEQCNASAARLGVTRGLTSTQAKARGAGLAFRTRSAEQEEAANEILIECAYGCAAYIEATTGGVCTMDLRGLALANGTTAEREAWGLRLIERLEEFGLPARVGVAATPGLAWQAARMARLAGRYREIGDAAAFRAELEIAELSPGAELLEILGKWGIRTAGELVALGKAQVGERLGPEGLALYEEARGEKARPLKLTAPKQSHEEYFEFEPAIEMLEPLLFMVRRFLDQFARRLGPAGLAVQRIELELGLESGETHRRTIEAAAPTREVETLFRIAHNHLENVRTASAVRSVRMRAHPVGEETRQFQLFETAIRDPNRFYETIGRAGALLGPERVGTPRVRESHRADDIRMERVEPGGALQPAERGTPRRGPMLRRFRPPLPATVRLRERAPVFVKSSRVSGAIEKSAGPWRSSGNWWENGWSREEWDIETKEGGLYRLYRDNAGWFVEGAYD